MTITAYSLQRKYPNTLAITALKFFSPQDGRNLKFLLRVWIFSGMTGIDPA